jgi:hypothetical protein
MKDEEAIDWKEGFPQLPLDKENKLKEGSCEAWGERNFFLFFLWIGKRMSV